MSNIPTPKEVLLSWVEAFNQANPDKLSQLYIENSVNHQVMFEPVKGREALRETFKREFSAAEMVCIVEKIYEDGEHVIMEWKDPKGLRGCGFFHVQNGKIVSQRGYWDQLSFQKVVFFFFFFFFFPSLIFLSFKVTGERDH